MTSLGKPGNSKEDPNLEHLEQLKLLAETSLRINQMETSEEVADLLCKQVKAIVGKGYVAVTLMDDAAQTLSLKATQGFEDRKLIDAALGLIGTDPLKTHYPVKDMTSEELAGLRCGRLQLMAGGIHAILVNKFPKMVCAALERLLDIRFVYSMGFVHHQIYLGSIVILTDAKSDVEANLSLIEDLVAQAAAAFRRIYTETLLRENEEFYYNLSRVNSGFRFSCIKTGEGDFTFEWITGIIEEITGYSPEETKQHGSLKFMVHPGDGQIFDSNIASLVPGEGRSCELRINHKNGQVRWLKLALRVVADAHSGGYRLFCGCEDISERKQVEQALRESEDHFRTLFEKAAEGIIYVAPDSRITEVNEAFAKMHGYTVEELRNIDLQVLDVDDLSSIHPERMRRIVGGEDLFFEVRHRHKDGRIIELEVAASSLSFNKERVFVAYHRDITERKKTDWALRKSEQTNRYFATLVESSEDAITSKDLDGIVTSWNKGAEKLYGYAAAEIVGQPISLLAPPHKYDEIPGILQGIARGKVFKHFETQRLRKDGSTIDVSLSISPMSDTEANIIGASTIARDITARKQSELLIAESENRFHSLFSNMTEGVALHQITYSDEGQPIDYRIEDINPAFEMQTGIKAADILGFLSTEAYRTESPPYWETYERVARTGEPCSFETYFQPMDKTFSISVYSPKPGWFATVFSDITKRKHAEDALRASEEHFRTVIETAIDAYWLADTNGNLLEVNDSYCRMSGYSRDELLTISLPAQEGEANHDETIAHIQHLMEAGQDRFETRHLRKDGGSIDVDVSVQYRPENGGRIIVFLRDITERKADENRIKASLAEKEVLLKEIHHRVKNNMQVISSLLRMQSGFLKDEDDKRMFLTSQQRIQSMSLVYNKLYQSDNLASISLKEYVKDLTGNLIKSSSFSAESPRLIIDVDDIGLSLDFAIPCGLIINEVITNSLKYAFPTGQAGQIHIIIHQKDGRIEMALGDNGAGMPEGVTFSSTKSLGMSLIQTLAVHQLSGTLELKRENGTEYCISFPLVYDG